jgi:tetratricopeptide (TPR) repeat protein
MARASRSTLTLVLLVAGALVPAVASAQRSGDEGAAQAMPTVVGTAAIPKPPPPPVPVNVLAVPFPISGAVDDQIALLVEAGGKALLANNESATLAGEIKVSAMDGTGKVVDEFLQAFALDATDELLQKGGLKLYAVLRVPPGDYKIVATVRNTDTRGHGEREVTLHAPDFARKEAAMSPPLFADRADRWRVFRQSDSPHEELPFPFVDRQGGGFLPSASPTLPPTGGEVVVYAYGPLTDAQTVAGRLADGAQARVEVLDSAQGRFAIERRLLLRLSGPIPEGSHRLEVTLADSAGSHTTAAPFAVLANVAPPAEIAKAAAPAEEQPPADEAPALPEGWTKEQLAERYRAALARAAGGDLDGAAKDLADLEVAATPKRTGGQLKGLRSVERDALEAAMGPPQGLLPVIYLAVREDIELLRRNEAWMAAQNRLFLGDLVEAWVKANHGDPAARHLAAQLLAWVGSSAQALAYEPSNELALLRSSISAEKSGLLNEATQLLQTLLKAHPESAHGRLRLGVVMRRLGQDAEATRVLTEVMNDASAPRWVAGLACQQLAEMAHAKGQADRAEAVLKQGIEKIGLQSLYLQLAYYLDERQRPDESIAVLNGMPITAGATEMSGRHLYNAPPEAEMAVARQQVEARVAGEWTQMRAALRIAAVPQQGSR